MIWPAHADRLAARVASMFGARDRQHAALDLRRPAGEVAQVRDAPRDVDVARRASTGLPLSSDSSSASSSACVFDQRRASARHQLLAPRSPASACASRALLEGRARGGDGAVDVLGAGLGDRRDLAAGGGVERLERARRRPRRRARRRSAAAAGRETNARGRRSESWLCRRRRSWRSWRLYGSRTIFSASRRSYDAYASGASSSFMWWVTSGARVEVAGRHQREHLVDVADHVRVAGLACRSALIQSRPMCTSQRSA